MVLWFGLSKFQNLTVHLSIVRCQYEELSMHMPFEAAAQKDFCLPASVQETTVQADARRARNQERTADCRAGERVVSLEVGDFGDRRVGH